MHRLPHTIDNGPDGFRRWVRHSGEIHSGRQSDFTMLSWTNVPAGTVGFLLHMHDMEASRNRTTDDQLHWLVWNIPGTATGLPEGVPTGAQLPNGAYQISASGAVYRGPGAPATGPRHHYTFELFALDTKVDVQPGTDPFETRTNILKAIQGHILGRLYWAPSIARIVWAGWKAGRPGFACYSDLETSARESSITSYTKFSCSSVMT